MLAAELEHQLGAVHLAVSFEVAASSTLALAGPSGAGKTTILRLLAGTARPRRGRIACDGAVWLDTARRVWWPPERRRCGFVFQDYALFPHLTAWQNVAYGIRERGRGARRARAIGLLDRFGLADRADARPQQLSGGERQRVALARALAARPSVLLLDEPLSALDARTRTRSGGALTAILRELELPVVLVTHDFTEAAQLGDEVAVIDGGRVVQRGSASALAGRPANAFVADFTGAVVLTGSARAAGGGLTLVELDGGGEVSTTDGGSGRVGVIVYPWEITIRRPTAAADESAQNQLRARISSMTVVGNRVRVALAAGQPIVAEVTRKGADELSLEVGREVIASWKATATRLVAL